MLRRLHLEQPDSFEFTPENQKWAEAQISKYPTGREASAIIALLWRAQEQEGWLTRPAMEHVAGMLGLAYIRALEVATFYFMFQLQPVGSVAHVQVCGTTSCMICGAEDLIAVCKDKIAPRAHEVSEDGKFSWEEVECLGACSNAPMAQIGKDYYEDLTTESFGDLLDRMAKGEVPRPGSQIGRFSSEPASGVTTLFNEKDNEANASVTLSQELGDTLKRIDGTEDPLRTPWNPVMDSAAKVPPPVNDDLMPPTGGNDEPTPGPQPGKDSPVSDEAMTKQEADADEAGRPDENGVSDGPDSAAMTDHVEGAGESTTKESGHDREDSSHAGDGPSEASTGGPAASGARSDATVTTDEPGDGGRKDEDHGSGADDRTGDTGTDDDQDDDDQNDEESAAANTAASEVAEGDEERPEGLDGPRAGKADDLKRIKGVGPKLEEMLHGMGVYHFDQVARWRAPELAWVDRNIEGFKGRVLRDNWVGQAKRLNREGQTGD